jgi:transposase
MPRKSPYQIDLDQATRNTLEARARKYTSAYREVVRARIVLMAANGMDNDEIALRLNTSRDVVSMWRKRFFQEGLEGLEERPRHGRPAVFSPRGGG